MNTLLRWGFILLFGMAILGTLAGCKPPPNAEPVSQQPLKMTLHARTAVYMLDFHNKSPADYRMDLRTRAELLRLNDHPFFPQGPGLPAALPVDLELEIRNTTTSEVHFFVGGPHDRVFVNLTGPGVIRMTGPQPQNQPIDGDWPAARVVRLQPGQSYFEKIDRVESIGPFRVHREYWTHPGDYQIHVTRQLPKLEMEPDGLTLTCAPAFVKVLPGQGGFDVQ